MTRASEEAMPLSLQYDIGDISGKKILVVEDNEKHRQIVGSQLKHFNLLQSNAGSGEEALEHLQQHQDYDLVITDLRMPGMGGIELAKRIKTLYPQLPVILLSAFGHMNAEEHKNVFSAILTKPVKHQLLYKVIANELSKNAPVTHIPVTNKLSTDFAISYPMKILVAEDNAINRFLIITTLKKLGYEAVTANDGQLAIEEINKQYYDLIFMDMQMPEMDGCEATIHIRSKMKQQPVIIALTANARVEDRELCFKAGMNDYISKPIELNTLIAKLEHWWDKRSTAAASPQLTQLPVEEIPG
jgi:CheY-like chemotaxis protein